MGGKKQFRHQCRLQSRPQVPLQPLAGSKTYENLFGSEVLVRETVGKSDVSFARV